jgi:hypothetical protein
MFERMNQVRGRVTKKRRETLPIEALKIFIEIICIDLRCSKCRHRWIHAEQTKAIVVVYLSSSMIRMRTDSASRKHEWTKNNNEDLYRDDIGSLMNKSEEKPLVLSMSIDFILSSSVDEQRSMPFHL